MKKEKKKSQLKIADIIILTFEEEILSCHSDISVKVSIISIIDSLKCNTLSCLSIYRVSHKLCNFLWLVKCC
jgi:hypothetical protein